MRLNRQFGSLLALAACLSLGTSSRAQEENEQDADEADTIEEIVVTVNRSGDPVDVDALYLEQLRDQVIKQFESLQAEQEKEVWRQSLRTSVREPDSRISWGYDARSEAAMRRSTINDLPMDQVKPATVISINF